MNFSDLAKIVQHGDKFSFKAKPGYEDIYEGAILECINWPYAPVWPVGLGDERCIEFMYPEDDEFRAGQVGSFFEFASDWLTFQLVELAGVLVDDGWAPFSLSSA